MRFIDWFAGIGGFHLAFKRAGHECVGACEIEEFPRDVYTARFGAPDWFPPDIKEIDPDEVPEAEIWLAGSPCQGFSVAGQRRGTKDPRSGLLRDWLRLAERCKPRWLLLENVPGLTTANEGQDFSRLLSRLAHIGYMGSYRILDGRHFGVPQRRRRLFLLASRARTEDPGAVLLERKGRCWNPPSGEQAWTPTPAGLGGCFAGGDSDPSRPLAEYIGPLMAHSKRHGHAMTTQQAAEDGQLIVGVDLQNTVFSGDVAATVDTSRPSRGGGPPGPRGGTVVVSEIAGTLSGASNGTGGDRPPGMQVDTAASGYLVVTAHPDPAYCLAAASGARGAGTGRDSQETFVVAPNGGEPEVVQGYRSGGYGRCDEENPTRAASPARLALIVEGVDLQNADLTGDVSPTLRGAQGFASSHTAGVLEQGADGGVGTTPIEPTPFPDPAYCLADESGHRTGSGRDAQDTFVVKNEPTTFYVRGEGRCESRADGTVNALTVSKGGGSHKQFLVDDGTPLIGAFYSNAGSHGVAKDDFTGESSPPLKIGSGIGISSPPAIAYGNGGAVRRLTPVECERLQGFPDGHTCLCGTFEAVRTALREGEHPEWETVPLPGVELDCTCADGKRYRALGNAVAVPVVEWIARRMPPDPVVEVHAVPETKECPKCGHVGPTEADFGIRRMRESRGTRIVIRPQSQCRSCRMGAFSKK
jgi:DNA-cytosine methyltransferase